MGQLVCSCGRSYWPKQAWAHERCEQKEVPLVAAVVNAVANVVVNRKKDRHKKTPERLEYIRKKMREHRRKRAGLD